MTHFIRIILILIGSISLQSLFIIITHCHSDVFSSCYYIARLAYKSL